MPSAGQVKWLVDTQVKSWRQVAGWPWKYADWIALAEDLQGP